MLSKSLSRKKLHQVAPSQPPPSNSQEKMSTCPKCGKPVYFAERKVILGKDWHSHCLRCEECDKPLTPGQHSAHRERPYCNGCYQRLFGPDGYRPGSIEPRKVLRKAAESGDISAAERQDIITRIQEYNLYKETPRDKLTTKEVNGRVYFEGVLKIYWGLSKPITLAPGVMYSKNRNSRASIYDFYGVDDAAYLMMLEEAAKVRKRRELFEASEKSKLQEIAENAWDSKERMPRPESDFTAEDILCMSLPPGLDGSTSLPGTLERKKKTKGSSLEPEDGVDGSMPSKPLMRGTRKRSASFRRISRIKKKEERGHDSKRQFTPPYGTPTNLRIHSAIKTKDVIIMLLAKFKVENDPSDFGLCVVHDSGFKEPCKEDSHPLQQRLKLGPNEDIAKIFIMEASECQDIEVSSEIQDYIKFSLHELEIFCKKFQEEQNKEEEKIKKRFLPWKEAITNQLGLARNSHNHSVEETDL